MQFTQTSAVAELYAATDTGTAPAGRLLLLLPAGSSTPTTLSFDQAWQGGGALLFLPAAVPDPQLADFAVAARTFLDDPRNSGARFAWLAAPVAGALLEGTVLPVTGGDSPVVAFATRLALRNVSLQVPAGAAITVSSAQASFNIGAEPSLPVTVSAQYGGATAGLVTGPVSLALTGSLQGCLRLPLELQPDDLDALDIGLRYFYAPEPGPGDPASEFFLCSQSYRVFAGPITVYPCLDPLAPLDASRSFLAFSAADSQLPPTTAPAVPSYLRSTLNDSFTLTPLTGTAAPTGPARLVFSPDQQSSAGSARDPLYLTPAGDFAISTRRVGGAELMAGLSGVESFALPAAGAVLSFYPGQPAFAAGFVAGQPGVSSPLRPATVPTTSFAGLAVSGGQVDYYAQPDQSVLYNYPDSTATGVSTVVPLAAVSVQAATLLWPPAATTAFPLLPYAGAGGSDLPLLAQLEAQVISPTRRRHLQAKSTRPVTPSAAPPQGTPPSPASTTPQGLLASYVPGGSSTEWSRIVLGQMAVTERQLALTKVSGDLLSAFQSNKMFLVVSDPAAIQAFLLAADAGITIGGDAGELWQFDLTPAGWAGPGTILILKFFDQTVEELAGRPASWAPGAFNADAGQTSAQLGAIIEQARQRAAAGDLDYAGFLAAVTDPSWNGVLALNVPAPLDELPAELRGLAAGIDPALFRAHHVGITAAKISVPGPGSKEPIKIADSGIFALIDYAAPAPLPANVAKWAFQVATLKVLFSDSTVTSFSSTIDLQVNSLFGEAATLGGGTNNIVTLYGVYQKHEVNGQITESYTFQTQSGQDAVFDLTTSQTLNAVIMSKAQFVTVTSDTTATEVTSQFLFWGLIDFVELGSPDGKAAFDAFSFGRQAAGDRAGLAFSNLILSMSINPQTPQAPPAFSFDAGNLALDLAASTPRPHSLFQHLPLTVAGLTQAEQGSAPTDLGFMGVQTPLSQTALAYPWFSLNYNLNLGTPGALAAAAGFVASLTVAWSPAQAGNYRVFVGLKLPGSSGAKRSIPIQGLFDISFRSLQILSPAPDTFVLVLYGIGFSFLSFTFPPSGQVNFALFGDPAAEGKGDTSLGWYAAYAKSGGNTPVKPSNQLPPPPLAALIDPATGRTDRTRNDPDLQGR